VILYKKLYRESW